MIDEFEQNPRFENHFCHFRPWSEHYKDAPGETGTLARMLGYAWDERDKLCNSGVILSKKHAALLFAFIKLVETGKAEPFDLKNNTNSVFDAWESIQLINEWRSTNKLNIKDVDV